MIMPPSPNRPFNVPILRAYRELEARVKEFAALPLETMDRATLQRALEAIGRARTPR